MNTILDRKGQLSSFITGHFMLNFDFIDTNTFAVTTCVYHLSEDGRVRNIEDKIAVLKRDVQLEENKLEVLVSNNKIVCIRQEFSAATLLADDKAEDALAKFLTIAESARKAIKKKRNKS
eukprot:CAMPEP_0202448398 /NCGR_PEP_ID=MMETSP1360-20130828/7207_1 /ASSEMBLY_ACC=CAM_ASM_000848 /TAXON_ID=515479 /ORGANISM="Licmophora paradoxa, Strain CCMP2313" /LENGTH=119 /DNA_ID=CAMNT_0049065947 /DNA_START=186 /DNA_END=542 /DNA_ORIENTATION=+